MGYRLSDHAPAYALLILAGIALVAIVVVITMVYGALHGISPL